MSKTRELGATRLVAALTEVQAVCGRITSGAVSGSAGVARIEEILRTAMVEAEEKTKHDCAR